MVGTVIGKRLREERSRKGLTQKELAALIGVTDAAIGMWENDRRTPDPEILQRLADIFGVTIDYLVGRTNVRGNASAHDADYDTPVPTEAAHRTDGYDDELPEEARKALEEYKEFLRQKYGKR